MMCRRLLIVLITAALPLSGCSSPQERPNFVFILTDDLGWMDLGYAGSQLYETPRIDRLAAEGMVFTNAYAASPVCSPTRASILTGRHPARLNITDWIPGDDPRDRALVGPDDFGELPLHEVTLAESFSGAGYATGFIGKWHLGSEGFHPENQGFDINIGGHHAGHPASYFFPYKNDRSYWDVPDLEQGKEGEYLTDRLTDESIAFIESNRSQPFLLFLSHYAVHTPIQSKQALEIHYRKKLENQPRQHREPFKAERDAFTKQIQDDPAYAGMIHSLDESVGRIRDALSRLDLDKKTVIFFFSDNGGLSTIRGRAWSPTSNLPLRAGKGWLYEGGIRVPMIVHWPGKTDSGVPCDTPVISTDFFPTMLDMAGFPLEPNNHRDGVSLVPLLYGKKELSRSSLFFYYPHYHGSGNRPAAALRKGSHKLIHWFEDDSVELYDLQQDQSEENNLASKLPAQAAQLEKELEDWYRRTDARLPVKKNESPEWLSISP
jgi:arylsulfatase A-like enzyme